MAQGNKDDDQQAPKINRKAPKSSRREFLTGMGAIKAAQEQLQQSSQIDPWQHPGELDGIWEQYSKSAMACQFEFSFNMHQYRQAASATMLGFQLIDDLEDQLTIYRDHSEVSRLNRQPAGTCSRVEPGLFALLKLAKQIHRETDGAFDITAGELSRLWGFESRNGKLPSDGDIANVLESIGSDLLELQDADLRVKTLKEGVKINLGGIGKGYALDRVANLFEEHGINDFSIHGGQSSVLARGSGSSQLGSGWQVGISHPSVAGVRLGTIQLSNQALGTSGTARQGFFHKGKRYGHIIDPRTGWPSNHHLSTTVVSDSAAVSDALATAFYVMESSDVEKYCADHPEIKSLLVQAKGKSSGRVKVIAFNFDDAELNIVE